MKFTPCIDQCTRTGTYCEGCGRSHEDIIEMKKRVMSLVDYGRLKDYDNIEDFSNAIAKTILKKLDRQRNG